MTSPPAVALCRDRSLRIRVLVNVSPALDERDFAGQAGSRRSARYAVVRSPARGDGAGDPAHGPRAARLNTSAAVRSSLPVAAGLPWGGFATRPYSDTRR